jgi:hypothetical protein
MVRQDMRMPTLIAAFAVVFAVLVGPARAVEAPGIVSRALAPESRPPSATARTASDAAAATIARPDVVRIVAQFGRSERLCSGALVSPRVVVTSGRCVHQGAGGEFALGYWVAPGHEGASAPYGEAFGSLLYTFTEWTERSDPAFDIGIVVLDRAVGDSTGWVAPARSDGCAAFIGPQFTWPGYSSLTFGPISEQGVLTGCTETSVTAAASLPFVSGTPLISADRQVHAVASAPGPSLPFTRFNARVFTFLTETLLPTLKPCDVTLDHAHSELGAGAGAAQVAIITGQGCTWSISGERPAWLTMSQYNGVTISRPIVQVAANAGAARSATLTLGGQAFTIAQAAAGPSANTRFASADQIGGGALASSVNTSGIPLDPDAPAPLGVRGPGLWWRWTAPTTAPTVASANSDGFANAVGIYTGSGPNALTLIAEGRNSASFDASAGVAYTIFAAGIDHASGPLRLRMDQLIPGAIAQTGWWWNPAEPGRGFFIETNGIGAFVGTFVYDSQGAPTWYVSQQEIQTRSYYTAPLLAFADGAALGAPHRTPRGLGSIGTMSLTFSSAAQGVFAAPATSIPLERFSFSPGGIASDRAGFAPQTGWWWNASEPGVGYALEVQGDRLMLGIAHFDEAGTARWSLATGMLTTPAAFETVALGYYGGQAFGQSYRPPSGTAPVGQLSVGFLDSSHALLRLPGGRTVAIERFRF